MNNYGGWNFMPVTAMVAANASLKHTGLVAERKKINAGVREETFQWLDRNGYSYIRSESNCFMLDTKRPAKEIIDAMAAQKVFIGRIWPVWPTYARITVGTRPEMEQFQAAFKKAMSGAVTAKVARAITPRRDGISVPRIISCSAVESCGHTAPTASIDGAVSLQLAAPQHRRRSRSFRPLPRSSPPHFPLTRPQPPMDTYASQWILIHESGRARFAPQTRRQGMCTKRQ